MQTEEPGALAPRPTPEATDLARRRVDLARLERSLAEEEAAWAAYADALDAFQRRYLTAFGATLGELDALDAEIAERAAAVRPDDASKQRRAARARARLAPPQPGREAATPPKPTPTDELRALFRALTKRIHPDLAADEDERQRREALMVQANAAYAAGDVAVLAHLAAHQAPEAAEAGHALEALARRIALTTALLGRAEARRQAAEATPLARLMRRVSTAEADGRDLFRKLAAELEDEVKQARKRLRALTRRAEKRAR